MTNRTDNLILIPARSGSTRVQGKNIRMLGNKHLLGHAIESALKAGCGRVVVSTNSEEFAEIARSYGAETPFLRPESISTAEATSIAVIIHALLWFQKEELWSPNLLAFRPPTNPFLESKSIHKMFEKLDQNPQFTSVVSIAPPKTHPLQIVRWNQDESIQSGLVEIDGKTIMDFERSQDWPEVWEGSPACRISRASYFYEQLSTLEDPLEIQGKTYHSQSALGYPISATEALDINDESDFQLAQLYQNKKYL